MTSGLHLHVCRLISEIPARTRVHGRHHHEARGEGGRTQGPGDRDRALFERLAKHLQTAAMKLGQFIKEQNAMVRQADFTGCGSAPSSYHTGIGDGVVRRSERARRQQWLTRRQSAQGCKSASSPGSRRGSAAAESSASAGPASSCRCLYIAVVVAKEPIPRVSRKLAAKPMARSSGLGTFVQGNGGAPVFVAYDRPNPKHRECHGKDRRTPLTGLPSYGEFSHAPLSGS